MAKARLSALQKTYLHRIDSLVKGSRNFAALMGHVKSSPYNSVAQKARYEVKIYDETWINQLEDGMAAIDRIIANPRRFIKEDPQIVMAAMAKRVTAQSIQHLAAHTEFVRSVDKKGNVTPEKILSVTMEDDVQIYENRFVMTLINKLILFIEKRYNFIRDHGETRNSDVLVLHSAVTIDGVDYECDNRLKVSRPSTDNGLAEKNAELLQKITRLRERSAYYLHCPFMLQMAGAKTVRSPVNQTNMLRKSPDYHKAYLLWKFIDAYSKLGVTYQVKEIDQVFDVDYINEIYSMILGDMLTLHSHQIDEAKVGEKAIKKKEFTPKIFLSLEDETFLNEKFHYHPWVEKELPPEKKKKEQPAMQKDEVLEAKRREEARLRREMQKKEELEAKAEELRKKEEEKEELARLKALKKKQEQEAREAARLAAIEAKKEAERKERERLEAERLAKEAEEKERALLLATRKAIEKKAREDAEAESRRQKALDKKAAIDAEKRAKEEAKLWLQLEKEDRKRQGKALARELALLAKRKKDDAAKLLEEEKAREQAKKDEEAALLAAKVEEEKRLQEEMERLAEQAKEEQEEKEKAARQAALLAAERLAEEEAAKKAEAEALKKAAEEEAIRKENEERAQKEEAEKAAREEAARKEAERLEEVERAQQKETEEAQEQAEEKEAAERALLAAREVMEEAAQKEAERLAAEEAAKKKAAEEAAQKQKAEEEAARLAQIERERKAAEEAAIRAEEERTHLAEEAAKRAEEEAARLAREKAAREAARLAVSKSPSGAKTPAKTPSNAPIKEKEAGIKVVSILPPKEDNIPANGASIAPKAPAKVVALTPAKAEEKPAAKILGVSEKKLPSLKAPEAEKPAVKVVGVNEAKSAPKLTVVNESKPAGKVVAVGGEKPVKPDETPNKILGAKVSPKAPEKVLLAEKKNVAPAPAKVVAVSEKKEEKKHAPLEVHFETRKLASQSAKKPGVFMLHGNKAEKKQGNKDALVLVGTKKKGNK